MFKIGEFSKINQVTVKTLRHYDEIGLLKPAEVDEITGYRMYSTAQLPDIQRIISLKNLGLSLNEIKEMLVDKAKFEQVVIALEKRQIGLEKEIGERAYQLKMLQTYLSLVRKDKNMSVHIVIKELPAIKVVAMRKIIKNYDDLGQQMPIFGRIMEKHGVKCAKSDYCFNLYHNHEFRETDIDVEMCQEVMELKEDADGVEYRELMVVPMAACLFHKGSYRTIGQSYAQLMQWVEENDYELVGEIRESYIDGMWNKENEVDWLTELQAPVKKK